MARACMLSFDTSGSAMIRFHGPVAAVDVHWADLKVAQANMICPDSIGATAKHLTCKYCQRNPGAKEAASKRRVGFGWDIAMRRWCFHVAPPRVLVEIFRKCLEAGATKETMLAGMGPNVLLQRIGKETVVAVMAETIGVPCPSRDPVGKATKNLDDAGIPKMPDPDDILDMLRERSLWLRYSNAAEARLSFHLGVGGMMGMMNMMPGGQYPVAPAADPDDAQSIADLAALPSLSQNVSMLASGAMYAFGSSTISTSAVSSGVTPGTSLVLDGATGTFVPAGPGQLPVGYVTSMSPSGNVHVLLTGNNAVQFAPPSQAGIAEAKTQRKPRKPPRPPRINGEELGGGNSRWDI